MSDWRQTFWIRAGGATAVSMAAFALALRYRLTVNVWVGTGVAALLSFIVYLRVQRGRLFRDFDVSTRRVLVGVLAGGVMAASTHVLYRGFASAVPGLETEVARLYANLRNPPGPWAALPLLIAVVVAEECVFRGMLFGAWEERFGVVPAIAVASVAYVMPQFAGGSWVLGALAALCGFVWTVVRAWTGNVVAPLVTHLVWDVCVFVLLPVH